MRVLQVVQSSVQVELVSVCLTVDLFTEILDFWLFNQKDTYKERQMEDWVTLSLNKPISDIRGLWLLGIGPFQAFYVTFSLGLPSGSSGKRIILVSHPVLAYSTLILLFLNFLFINLNHRTLLFDVFGIQIFSILLLSHSVSSVLCKLRLYFWALAMSGDWQRLIRLLQSRW